MAIRWSAKGRRFYDDQTGYPVTKDRGFRSSIARRDYKQAHRKRRKSKTRQRRKRVHREKISKGYRVRPLAEEFAEELADFDGTTKAQTMNRYADTLADEEPDVYEQEDRYSED